MVTGKEEEIRVPDAKNGSIWKGQIGRGEAAEGGVRMSRGGKHK